MTDKAMLTMESRIHGDMYVRFGGRFLKTYRRKAARRRVPSLLKEIAGICGITKPLTMHIARHSFACLALANGVSMEVIAKMLGHSDVRTTKIYAKVIDKSITEQIGNLSSKFGSQK